MKMIFFTAMLGMLTVVSFAQAPSAIDWEKNYGGTSDDASYDITETSDGGYIMVGYTESDDGDVSGNHGSRDGWVVKISATGSVQWQKALGGTGNDAFYKVIELQDGNFMVGGESASNDGNVSSNHGSFDVWLVKLSSTGSLQWERSYGGSDAEYFGDMSITSDGGFVITSASYSNDGNVTGHHGVNNADFWVLKLAQNGNIEWQKSLGGTDHDFSYGIMQTSDGGYMVIGSSLSTDGDVTNNQGSFDAWIVRLSFSGNIQWQKSFGGSGSENAGDIIEVPGNGYVFIGSSASNDGDITGHHGAGGVHDYWVVKISSTGAIDWQKSLGGSGEDGIGDIRLTNSGDYIISGTSGSNDGNVNGMHGASDYWLVKVSSSGDLVWQKPYGGTLIENCEGLHLTSDGGIIMAGKTYSNDGDVGGNHNANADVWVVKLEGTLSVKSLSNELPITISPNPATNNITIEGADIARAEVYDAVGKLVLSAEHTNTLSLGSLSKGMYMIKLEAEDGERYYSGKIIKE